jgi:hypothetical protein
MLTLDPINSIDLEDARLLPISEYNEDLQGYIRLAGLDTEFPTLTYDYVVEKVSSGSERVEDFMMRTLANFRLFKETPNGVYSRVFLEGESEFMKIYPFRHFFPFSREIWQPYLLKENEQEEFAALWKRTRNMNFANYAVYRFTLADFRPYLYDRFSDYVESMENLLVPDYGDGQLSYKLSSRGAMILGRSVISKNRAEIYEDLKWAYALRSKIVHGPVPDETSLGGRLSIRKWEKANEIVRKYDRDLILFFHSKGCIDDSVKRRELLDKLILDSKIIMND